MLAAVERELAGEPVVVIGVHSPKFPTEADAEMVRQAIRRHGVTHPVVVDEGHDLWDRFGIRAWPTLVVVGPDGVIVGAASGEPDTRPLVELVRGILAEHRDRLASGTLPLAPEPAPPGGLAFPGGLAVDGDRVYVADTGHHQVVVCDGAGTELRRFGDGRPGLCDGPTGRARFHHPHGLAVEGARLVVADTGNHAVRAVDLAAGEVTTLAGSGRRGRVPGATAGPVRALDLRSPWDVAVHERGDVLVAMAGSHQVWAVGAEVATVFAGSGREARADGPYRDAAFAQPSGLAWRGDPDVAPALFVADAEISAVRVLAGGEVTTVAGGDLFAYGLVDGTGDEVRFQHPVGICAGPAGTLLVADTLNHAVRAVDPADGTVTTLFGDGTPFDAALAALERRPTVPSDARGAACCREPEAIAWDGRHVLLADTGNHRILALDPVTGTCELWLGGRP